VTAFARVVFGLLVLATFAAFFVAQRIKQSPSVIQRVQGPPVFSPNGDGRFDRLTFSFRLKEADEVDVSMVSAGGDEVRALRRRLPVAAYAQVATIRWDGRDDSGQRVPDGIYRPRITLRRQGRSIVVPKAFRLDTRPPRPRVAYVSPDPALVPELLPRPDRRPATIGLADTGRRTRVVIVRTAPAPMRRILGLVPRDGATKVAWDGRARGRPVVSGTYLALIETRDAAGNVGTSAPVDARGLPRLAPGRHRLPGRGGITVRYLGVQPPVEPVRAGGVAELFVDARRAHYRWSLRRVGGPVVKRGRGTRPRLAIKMPRGVSGAYVLRVTTARQQTQVPVAVLGSRVRRALVVLPAMTWQGRNPVDDDGDGLPNLLDVGTGVRLGRVLARDGLPRGFATHEAPVLGFLDRTGRRYDLTTDVALAAGRGPRLEDHKGVLLPGDTRWLPAELGVRLKRFVRRGGAVASLGTDSLRRGVRVTRRGRLVEPTPPAATDLFGARLRPVVRRRTELTNFSDDIALFSGEEGRFTGVDSYEESAVGNQADAVATAVTPAGRPVIVAARLGRGLVIRTGLPGFATRLTPDPASAALLARTWTLLSR
jgi:hypothetical protein